MPKEIKIGMNKTITAILFLLLVLPIKAQEEFVVRGFLGTPNISVSWNFQRSMFCYFQGNYIIARSTESLFYTFRVDSVISGSFYNSVNEIKKPPFNIAVALVNEAVVLDFRQYYTLQIRQFPNTNYFYVDNLSQVYPNENLWEKLTEHNARHQQNIDILTSGTLYERRELLGRLQSLNPNWRAGISIIHNDYRYIPYILPYMTSKDSVIYYHRMNWSGRNVETGQRTGGTRTWEAKGLYSDFVFNYLNRISPFALPDRVTTDSIGWHKWHESLFSRQDCFPFVKYAITQSKAIVIGGGIRYFIPDISNRIIHFASGQRAYSLQIDTNELTGTSVLRGCTQPFVRSGSIDFRSYSFQNNEIPIYYNFFNGIRLYTLTDNGFCRQEKIIPLSFNLDRPSLTVHKGNDFLVFSSRRPDDYSHLQAGKINRKGEWIIEPKTLCSEVFCSDSGRNNEIRSFSFYQSEDNKIAFAFAYNSIRFSSGNEAIIVYKLNTTNLEIKKSAMLPIGIRVNFGSLETHLLKKDKTYLLLAFDNRRLFYKLLNSDLTPKTDFIRLSNWLNQSLVAKPTATSEGFLISWNDNDLSENLTRSVLIDATSGRQSDIINISNQRISDIFNVEFDENNVDIFIVDTDGNLIRKRIDKSEFGL